MAASETSVMFMIVSCRDSQKNKYNYHPDPEIRGGAVSKKLFSALRASFWSKNKGDRAPGTLPE